MLHFIQPEINYLLICDYCFLNYYLAEIGFELQPRSDGQQPSSTRKETSGCNLFCPYGKHISIYAFYLFNFPL